MKIFPTNRVYINHHFLIMYEYTHSGTILRCVNITGNRRVRILPGSPTLLTKLLGYKYSFSLHAQLAHYVLIFQILQAK